MSLSARGGDTTPGGNAALCGRLDPATSMPRPEAHAGAWPKSGTPPRPPGRRQGTDKLLGTPSPVCILGSGPSEPSSGLCRALLRHITPIPGVCEDPDTGGTMLPSDSYFNYIFILIVGRLAIILLTASRLLFFRGFGAKWRGVSSIKHQLVLWPGQQHFKVSFVSLNEPWCPQN